MALIIEETLTANGNVDFNWTPTRKEIDNTATVFATGTFGGGTIALLASPDGGTTYVAIPNTAGTAITFTANGITNYLLNGNQDPIASKQLKVRLNLSGATSPSVTIRVFNGE